AAPPYAVEGSDGRALAALVEARQHAEGGREDTLTFGAVGDAEYGGLRRGRGLAGRGKDRFYVDLVRRAAGLGLSVIRSGQNGGGGPTVGPVEGAPTTLAR